MTISMRYTPELKQQTWPIICDGEYLNVVKKYLLNDGISDDGVEEIAKNATKVLRYCPNPYKTDRVNSTGIVIGKVQSGKTSSFISLIGLAFDNQYDIVVVLGGTKNVLVNQNKDRIKEYFYSTEDVLVLDTNSDKELLESDSINNFIKRKKKVVIVALKTKQQIKHVADNVFKNSNLANKPVLVIDDEGDEASLNGKVFKAEMSATYGEIKKLKDVLNRHAFISVTATPQANMLIDTIDILSPDFGVLVYPGKGYCGLDVFHSDNTYTCEIPENEPSVLDDNMPQSLIDALSMFFVACAIQKKRGMKNGQKVSMMVHPSQKIIDHKRVYDKIKSTICDWREYSKNKKDVSYTYLKNIIVKAYEEYKKTTVKDIHNFDELEDDIIQAVNDCFVHLVNGVSIPEGKDDYFDFNIYVGGALLGRGLTIKGLTITYIIRTAKGISTVDTVQQRARWFGYKEKYLDLCRIFAVKKIIKEFKEIREHEEDLWSTIEHANLEGINFKNIARIFKLSDGLRMTRSNVARTENYSFSFWNKQTEFLYDKEQTNSNISILNEYRKKHEDDIKTIVIGSGRPYLMVEEIDFFEVKRDIIDRFIFPTNSKLNNALITKLESLFIEKGIKPRIDIIWMRDGITSKHNVDNGTIGNYFVGRRPKDKAKKPVYKGDEYEFVKSDVMQLQIHMIEDNLTRFVSPVLALYIPDDLVSVLTNLVIQSN